MRRKGWGINLELIIIAGVMKTTKVDFQGVPYDVRAGYVGILISYVEKGVYCGRRYDAILEALRKQP